MYYEHVSGTKHNIYLEVLIECDAINDLSQSSITTVYLDGGNFNRIKTVNLTQVASENINLFCSQQLTQCKGGSNRGLKKVIFKGLYDFKTLEPSSKPYRFFWKKNFRSNDIEILNSKNQYAYYTELLIYDTEVKNNSPKCLTKTVHRICSNEHNSISINPIDLNQDQVSLSISSPRISQQVELPFDMLRPYESKVYLANNKLIVPTNSKTNSSIIDIKLSERKNGKLLSESYHTIYFISSNCSNDAPILTGFNGSDSKDTSFCVGENITPNDLFIVASNPDLTRKLSFDVIGKRSYQIKNDTNNVKKLTWNWDLKNKDVGVHKFVVSVSDNVCPYNTTTTETYTITVRPSPAVTNINDFDFACDSTHLIAPQITSKGNYRYQWGRFNDSLGQIDTLSIAHIFTIPEAGNYYFKTKDTNTCSTTKTFEAKKSITGELLINNWCYQDSSKFKANVTSSWGEIKSYKWHFGDGARQKTITHNSKHLYDHLGSYKTFVIVTDKRQCIDSLFAEITLCKPSKLDLKIEDTCNNNVIISDLTNYNELCNLDTMLPGKGSYDTTFNRFTIKDRSVTDSFLFKTTAIYNNGCRVDTAFNISVVPSPLILFWENDNYLKSFAYRCNKPDTVLRASIRLKGNGIKEYGFSSASSYVQINDSTISTKEPGLYSAYVIDSLGCNFIHNIDIRDDIKANFKYNTICESTDTIKFVNLSNKGLTEIKSHHWKFGTGDESDQKNPQYYYDNKGDYTVKLTVIDNYDCIDSVQKTVYANSFDHKAIKFDSIAKSQIWCQEADTIKLGLPNYTHLDSINWITSFNKNSIYTGTNLSDGQNKNFRFTDYGNDLSISAEVTFNKNPGVGIGSCVYNYTTGPIAVFKKLDGSITSARSCIGDSAELKFEVESSGSPIKKINWQLWDINDNLLALDTFSIDPIIIFDTLDKYSYNVQIENQDGCSINKNSSQNNQFIEVQKITKPYMVLTDTACFKEDSKFEIKVRDFGEITHWVAYDQDYKQIYPKIDREIFLPGAYGNETIENGTVKHRFTKHGKNSIHIYMTGAVGNVSDCRSRLDTIIPVDTLPNVSFDYQTACAEDESLNFSNTTRFPKGDSLKGSSWSYQTKDFGNKNEVSKIFPEGGLHTIRLISKGYRCSDTTLQNVYVKHKPRANFSYDEEKLEAFIPIAFTDESECETELVKSFYEFGNNDTSIRFDPIYEYDSIQVYQVTHSVTSQEGCSDTISKRTDLNTYLEAPTAFTPNNDGTNDNFFIINKSIHQLIEYKIYNYQGKLIFDGETDPDAVWDGTFDGTPLETGVYILTIKGIGAYDTLFEIKENISLLR